MCLVNAAHVKNVPGRKPDRADARWPAKLLRYGLLQASFIPPVEQRALRALTRYRTKLVQARAREVTRVQGVLELANIELASVASDIRGVAGRAILTTLIAERAVPAPMAELAKGRLRGTSPVLGQRRGAGLPHAPHDLGAGGHGAGHHSRHQSTGWGAVGRRVRERYGARRSRRPPGHLERGRTGE